MSKRYYERLLRAPPSSSSSPFHSDFGSNILKKFGWTEGNGLGKDESGRKQCVTVRRFRQGAGLGASSGGTEAMQWTNWWDDMYNSVSAKLQVNGEVSSSDEDSTTDENEPNISIVNNSNCSSRSSEISQADVETEGHRGHSSENTSSYENIENHSFNCPSAFEKAPSTHTFKHSKATSTRSNEMSCGDISFDLSTKKFKTKKKRAQNIEKLITEASESTNHLSITQNSSQLKDHSVVKKSSTATLKTFKKKDAETCACVLTQITDLSKELELTDPKVKRKRSLSEDRLKKKSRKDRSKRDVSE
ncbi:G-patch domain-containing protein [Cardiosporidium cionae]|uniref:G-patch domain-containing protein n=1 Tax=Cardiosporidium cionae TaxID=476202 RepID=A0ABQ7J7J5_9APIC|nr:G-patch domain-containing protein [Cardiosporidium cionae]|eukprot:KAF8819957.1 G-patch domain-containing protein [Cardiosporidium cionae]